MRASREAYSVVFPIGTDAGAAVAALRSLAGVDWPCELVAEVVADESGIHHLLHIPSAGRCSVMDHLAAAIPGLGSIRWKQAPTGAVTRRGSSCRCERCSAPRPTATSRALLAGFSALRDDERVSLRWALRQPGTPPGAGAERRIKLGQGPRTGVARQSRRAGLQGGWTGAHARGASGASPRTGGTCRGGLAQPPRGWGRALGPPRSVRDGAVMPAHGTDPWLARCR